MKRYCFVYKTTNKLNGKIYVGVHTTDNLDDGYLGSGKHFENSLKKHGKEFFKREILSYHYTVKSALAEEARIVDSKFIRREDTYNIVVGGGYLGSGPDHPSYGKPYPLDKSGEKNPNFGNRGEKNPLFGRKYSDKHKEAIAKGHKGKKLSDEHVEKISEAKRSSLHKIKAHGDRAIELYSLGYPTNTISEIMADEGMLSQNRKIEAPYSRTALDSFIRGKIGTRGKNRLDDKKLVGLLKEAHQQGKRGSMIGKFLAAHGYFNKYGNPYNYKTTWYWLTEMESEGLL